MRVLRLLPLFWLLPIPLFAQTISAQRDPQAVAVVQAAITKMGGATAIGPLQSWTLQAEAEGRIDNGTINQTLTLGVPQNPSLPAGTAAKAPRPWARPRSLFVPALVSTILLQETQDPSFSLQQEIPSPVPNSTLVVFSLATKSGRSVAVQRWYFDSTTNLPTVIEFVLPAKIGLIESFPGVVTLSDYRAIGGVLYPFRIGSSLLRESGGETVTLQIVTPSTAVPSAATSGGAK